MNALRARAAANSCSALRTAVSRSGCAASPHAVAMTGTGSERAREQPTAETSTTPNPGAPPTPDPRPRQLHGAVEARGVEPVEQRQRVGVAETGEVDHGAGVHGAEG